MNQKIRGIKSDVRGVKRELKGCCGSNPANLEPSGPGMYLAYGRHDVEEWGKRIIDAGKSDNRLIWQSCCWYKGLAYPYLVTEGGKFDLTGMNPKERDYIINASHKFAEAGGRIICSIFDTVGEKAQSRIDLNAFNAINNIHGECIQGAPYSKCHHTDFRNKVEHGLKGDCGPDSVRMQGIFHQVAMNAINCLPPGSIIETGNELDSRTVEGQLVRLFDSYLREIGRRGDEAMSDTAYKVSVGGSYLWNNHVYSTPDGVVHYLGPDYLVHIPNNIVQDPMWAMVSCISLHHVTCREKNYTLLNADGSTASREQSGVERFFEYISPILDAYPWLGAIGDTDGIGSGYERDDGGRHSIQEETQTKHEFFEVFGMRAISFISKVLTDADAILVINEV
jgi:hypothetical protein